MRDAEILSNFILVATFATSCIAIMFGGMSLTGKNWLVNKANHTSGLIDSKDIYTNFYTVGYAFQAIATCLIFIILIISIFYDQLAKEWNMYVIIFIAIITMFLMGLIIMTLSATKFLVDADKFTQADIQSGLGANCTKLDSKTTPDYSKAKCPLQKLELSLLSSHSFIYYMINFFCSIMVIGLVFFSLGYMSNESDVDDDDDDSIDEREADSDLKTLSAHAYHSKKVTDKPAPNMTPVPNSSVQLSNFNQMKRSNQ